MIVPSPFFVNVLIVDVVGECFINSSDIGSNLTITGVNIISHLANTGVDVSPHLTNALTELIDAFSY